MSYKKWVLIWIGILLIAACRPQQETPRIRITLIADGRGQTFAYPNPATVDEFLRDPDIGIELGESDRVEPSRFTQLTDGMRITVVRVTEKTECERTDIPYKQTTILYEALGPGEQQIGQAGQNGILETCYRISYDDGVEASRVVINTTTIVTPQDEVIYLGPDGEVEPVTIMGTIAYMSNGNAWVIRGSSTAKRLLTTSGDIDDRGSVFSLSPDGRQLLFARKTNPSDADNSFNHLWLIPDVTQNTDPISLIPGDVLYADWVPGQQNMISYSTGEVTASAPGWQSLNDLYQMRIDPATGASLNLDPIVEPSSGGGGLYGWWGTRFQWSPDGQQLAWVRSDSLGLVDIETGELLPPLLNYAVLRPVGDWSWRATASWSPDSTLLATTVHGAPLGSELPQNSPAFNLAITDASGNYQAEIVKNVGIWSAPQYSPFDPSTDNEFPRGYLAYLRARDPFNSINGEYDLVVADRDGSNARVIFPPPNQKGLTAQASIFNNREFAWSPDGQQIAFIYQGNLWIVDVESGVSHQLTIDGGASNPVWTR